METETQLAEREKKLLSERELKARGVFFLVKRTSVSAKYAPFHLMWLSRFCLPRSNDPLSIYAKRAEAIEFY
jgi:hypothetical protein